VIHLWRIATDTPTYGADDLSGAGAASGGGRWNRIGTPALYTASSIALACVETLVHLGAASLPLNRYLVRIDVPDDIWARRTRLIPAVGWDALPPGLVSIEAGESWLAGRASALLEVPSVVVPEESNIIVNPNHPDARFLKATKVRKWTYDARFTGP
jgi:RES domain-containing protein